LYTLKYENLDRTDFCTQQNGEQIIIIFRLWCQIILLIIISVKRYIWKACKISFVLIYKLIIFVYIKVTEFFIKRIIWKQRQVHWSFSRHFVPWKSPFCQDFDFIFQYFQINFISNARYLFLLYKSIIVRERVRDFMITFALYVKKIFISGVCYLCYTELV
jgi:hypothetical protein